MANQYKLGVKSFTPRHNCSFFFVEFLLWRPFLLWINQRLCKGIGDEAKTVYRINIGYITPSFNMNSQTGLDYIIENQEFTQKLATGKTRWISDIKLFYPFNEIYITVVFWWSMRGWSLVIIQTDHRKQATSYHNISLRLSHIMPNFNINSINDT